MAPHVKLSMANLFLRKRERKTYKMIPCSLLSASVNQNATAREIKGAKRHLHRIPFPVPKN